MEIIAVRAPFNDLAIFAEILANKSLFHIWICQFYLVWIVIFCMIVRRVYAAVKDSVRWKGRTRENILADTSLSWARVIILLKLNKEE